MTGEEVGGDVKGVARGAGRDRVPRVTEHWLRRPDTDAGER